MKLDIQPFYWWRGAGSGHVGAFAQHIPKLQIQKESRWSRENILFVSKNSDDGKSQGKMSKYEAYQEESDVLETQNKWHKPFTSFQGSLDPTCLKAWV